MKRTTLAFLILATAMAVASVSRATVENVDTGIQAGASEPFIFIQEQTARNLVSEEFHQSYPLAANGRVSIENINGSVKISVWDQNEVKVDAVKRADKREKLEEAKIEVSTAGDSVRIQTKYPERNQTSGDNESRSYNNPASVEYTLTIPRRARVDSADLVNGTLEIEGVEGDVKVNCVNGNVRARGLTGEVKLSTVNGAVEATIVRLDESKPVSLNSVNGSVVLIMPSESNAQIRASTVHGGITNDFGLPVTRGTHVGHQLSGQVGTGGPRVRLSNVNGTIAIKRG